MESTKRAVNVRTTWAMAPIRTATATAICYFNTTTVLSAFQPVTQPIHPCGGNSHKNRQQTKNEYRRIIVITQHSCFHVNELIPLLTQKSVDDEFLEETSKINQYLSITDHSSYPDQYETKSVTSSPQSLLSLLRPSPNCKIEQMSVSDLAYIGDVVYELFIRCRTVWPPKRTSQLQEQVVSIVRAEHQSALLQKVLSQQTATNCSFDKTDNHVFDLTTDEIQIISRGRNTPTNARKQQRNNPVDYQYSTAFEALLGYLYITNTTRCTELLHWIDTKGLL